MNNIRKKNQMSRPADDAEKEVLGPFRDAVKDIVTPEQLKNDAYLLRWIRARDRNVDKAVLMLKTSVEWRKKNNVDSMEAVQIPNDFNEYFNCHFGGVDKAGRPVICVPFGEWDLRDMLDKGRKDDLVKFLIQALEILELTLHEFWKNQFPAKTKWQHTQFTVIFDLKGFTYAKLMHRKSIDSLLEIIKMYEANYPETLGNAVIINAPWVFSTLFGMIRPLLSEHTASKISIFDSKEANWKKAVVAIVDADQIPQRYGGTTTNFHPI